MPGCLISVSCWLISLLFRLGDFWSYANTVETAVLLVIVYDIVWHRLNAIRERKHEAEAEERATKRENAFEQRQIRREQQEILRKHWQELQSKLISLNRVASQLSQLKKYVKENNNSTNDTVRASMMVMTNRLPVVISDFGDFWGRIVAQLNVFPPPKELLVLEVHAVIVTLGESVADSNVEIKEETLLAMVGLSTRVAERGMLANPTE